MSERIIVCPMCGHRFDSSAHQACKTCPLNRDCQLVCCPVCGYETVDPEKSGLARLASRLFASKYRPEQIEGSSADHRREQR